MHLSPFSSRWCLPLKVVVVVVAVVVVEVLAAVLAVLPSTAEPSRGRDAQYYFTRWWSRSAPHAKFLAPTEEVTQEDQTPQIPAPTAVSMATSSPYYFPSSFSDLPLHEAESKLVAVTAEADTQILPPEFSANATLQRDPRFFQIGLTPVFSLFNIGLVSGAACTASSGDNGTCYSSKECTRLGGSSSGSCSTGSGTCCLFQKTCGGVTSQNCTYFVNSNYPKSFNDVGSCQLTINKVNSNICQLRLDFDNFMLLQPESVDHQCVNDRFTVSGGTPVPTICGTNSGNHMYVDLGPGATTPTVMTFITMGPSFDRKWKVKVSQIPCNTDYTAPTSCLQYLQGVTGQIKSFNFDLATGLQLSNQDYTICIRPEKNFCGIQYMACDDTVNTNPQSFTITGSTASPVGSVVGATDCNKDWLTIPCVSDNSRNPTTNCQDRLCGDNLNVVASTTGGNVRVFSYVKPFFLVYHTDNTEGSASPAELNNRGFCLNYVQQPCV